MKTYGGCKVKVTILASSSGLFATEDAVAEMKRHVTD
jgi:hypothetical protein